jgi:hypothetical protein
MEVKISHETCKSNEPAETNICIGQLRKAFGHSTHRLTQGESKFFANYFTKVMLLQAKQERQFKIQKLSSVMNSCLFTRTHNTIGETGHCHVASYLLIASFILLTVISRILNIDENRIYEIRAIHVCYKVSLYCAA